MRFVEFMELYDNWNGYITINDNDLNEIVSGTVDDIMAACVDLYYKEVIAFGFYDEELTVRLKEENSK